LLLDKLYREITN